MNRPVFALSAAIFAAAAANAQEPGRFELRLEEKDGARMAAVINLLDGGSAVAVGGATLDLLGDRDAQKTAKRLQAQTGIDIDGAVEGVSGEAPAQSRKILVHRMDYDEAENVASASPEERAYRPHQRKGRGVPDDMSLREDGVRRIIYVKGAGATEAAKFIDDIQGLEDDEKAAMKEAVGL